MSEIRVLYIFPPFCSFYKGGGGASSFESTRSPLITMNVYEVTCSSTYINLTQSLKNPQYTFDSYPRWSWGAGFLFVGLPSTKCREHTWKIKKIDSVWQSIENCSTLKYDICRLLHWNFHNWVSTWYLQPKVKEFCWHVDMGWGLW